MSKHYLRAVAAKHSERAPLAGQPAGPVSEADRLKGRARTQGAGAARRSVLAQASATPDAETPATAPRRRDVAATLGVGE